jgi:uncharacterized protein (TIGR02466 family)
MALHTLFPTRIYQKRVTPATAMLNKELKKECFKFRKIDEAGRLWSKDNYSAGGYTSYGSIANLHEISPTFEELGKKIDSAVRKYIRELELDVSPKSIRLCSMWINIMPSGCYHTMHLHPLSVISGTYYLQIPRGSRGLKFEDPRMAQFMTTPPRKRTARKQNQWFVEMTPKVGEVLLFESWLRHEVPAGKAQGAGGNQERLSISFNYNWV